MFIIVQPIIILQLIIIKTKKNCDENVIVHIIIQDRFFFNFLQNYQ